MTAPMIDLLVTERGNPGRVRIKRAVENPRRARATNAPSKKKQSGGGAAQTRTAFGFGDNSRQVVVKISGFTKSGRGATGKGAAPLLGHITYISRHGKLTLEDETGMLWSGKENVNALAANWQSAVDESRRPNKPNDRDVMHLVVSKAGDDSKQQFTEAVRSWAQQRFNGERAYVFVVHDDTDNLHAHLAVQYRGFDGRPMRITRDTLADWRQTFAASLREHGIEAEASPRQMRGVLRRPESLAHRHMQQPRDGRQPREPRVLRQQRAAAFAAMRRADAGRAVAEPPELQAARRGLRDMKRGWLALADRLDAQGIAIRGQAGAPIKQEALDRGRRETLRKPVAGIPAGKRTTQPQARLRGLSGWNLDGNRRHTELLLSANAPDDLGRWNPARDGLRSEAVGRGTLESGTRDTDRRPGERATGGLTRSEQNRELAQRIRSYVAALPEPQSRRDMLIAAMRQEQLAEPATPRPSPVPERHHEPQR